MLLLSMFHNLLKLMVLFGSYKGPFFVRGNRKGLTSFFSHLLLRPLIGPVTAKLPKWPTFYEGPMKTWLRFHAAMFSLGQKVREKGRYNQADPPTPFPASALDLSDEQGHRGCENPTHQRA